MKSYRLSLCVFFLSLSWVGAEGLVWETPLKEFEVPPIRLDKSGEEVYEVAFEGKNGDSSAGVEILSVEADCGCIGMDWQKGVIPPGGLTTLKILVKGSALYKKGVYGVVVSDSLGGRFVLRVKVTPRLPYYMPKILNWPESAGALEFGLEPNGSFAGGVPKLLSVKSLSSDYSVRFEEDGVCPLGNPRYRVFVSSQGSEGARGAVSLNFEGTVSSIVRILPAEGVMPLP